MDVVATDVNGGNAEVARDDDVPDPGVVQLTSKSPKVDEDKDTKDKEINDVKEDKDKDVEMEDDKKDVKVEEVQKKEEQETIVVNETEKIDEQEVNGDVKGVNVSVVKKNMTPVTKRKLRKTKANSTSAVESEHQDSPSVNANTNVNANSNNTRTRNQKRKLSEPDNHTSDDSMDFIGFDSSSLLKVNPATEILLKLIAEAEAEISSPQPSAKRPKRSLSKGPVRRNVELKTDDHQTEVAKGKKKLDKSDGEVDSGNAGAVTAVVKNDAGKSPPSAKTPVVSRRGMRNSHAPQTSSIAAAKQKVSADVTNPEYKEPFKYGWKRELVYKTETDSTKKVVEVSYYTPKGKKVRSLREIAEFLNTKELTVDNFIFTKEPTGINDPQYEIIKDETTPISTPVSAGPAKKIGTGKKAAVTKRLTGKISPTPAKTLAKNLPLKTSTPGIKVKVPVKRGSLRKDVSPPKETDVLGWTNSSNTTRRSQAATEKTTPYKSKRSLKKKAVAPLVEVDQRQYFMSTVCSGYNALSRVFQYLKVQELLRAARVCKMWRDLAAHPALWKTVRMKNSQVTDWDGLVATLQRHGTEHLDLRKMLIAPESDSIWQKFVSVIPNVKTLIKLELCRCPVMVVEEVIKVCPQLQVLSAMSIKCDWLNLEDIGNLKSCEELRLKAITGMSLHGDLTPLQNLTQLSHLSLTSVKELGKKKIDILASLVNLESLELGECSDFSSKFGTAVLCKLTKLERLRLEKGQGTCCTFDILKGVAKLDKLHQLELVNFDVKNGFDKHLANCKNIKRLLIIPTYISQSATSNNMVLGGVTELSDSLTYFVWGVTLELLRVTQLFVDQCNQMNKQVSGDSIPVLKPVPCLKLIEDADDTKMASKAEEKSTNSSNPQVDILPLPQLQKLLLTALPKTRVKILMIPFQATWRQSISDTASQ